MRLLRRHLPCTSGGAAPKGWRARSEPDGGAHADAIGHPGGGKDADLHVLIWLPDTQPVQTCYQLKLIGLYITVAHTGEGAPKSHGS